MQTKIIVELMHEASQFIKENREDFDSLAVARTNKGEYLLGVEFFCVPLHQCLPAENSVMQEAEKKKQRITHLMCLAWEKDNDPVLAVPSGETLDRLLKYSDKVNIALMSENEKIEFFELRELFPANWYTLAMQNDEFAGSDGYTFDNEENPELEEDEEIIEINENKAEQDFDESLTEEPEAENLFNPKAIY